MATAKQGLFIFGTGLLATKLFSKSSTSTTTTTPPSVKNLPANKQPSAALYLSRLKEMIASGTASFLIDKINHVSWTEVYDWVYSTFENWLKQYYANENYSLLTKIDKYNIITEFVTAWWKENKPSTTGTTTIPTASTPQSEFKKWLIAAMYSSAHAYYSRNDQSQPLGDYSWVRFGAMYTSVFTPRKVYMQSDGTWQSGGSPVKDPFGFEIGKGTFGAMAAYIRWQYGTKIKDVGWQNSNDIINAVVRAAGVPQAAEDGPVCSYICSIGNAISASKVLDFLLKMFQDSQKDQGGDGG